MTTITIKRVGTEIENSIDSPPQGKFLLLYNSSYMLSIVFSAFLQAQEA
jgi:hypothetical protein